VPRNNPARHGATQVSFAALQNELHHQWHAWTHPDESRQQEDDQAAKVGRKQRS
jgi:hypothetical protein